jgi:hypothetical protein
MGKLDIIDCGYANYMQDVKQLADLPHNCILNKVRTGCGGTSVAMWNDQKYVIAVPNVDLINSKLLDLSKHNKTCGTSIKAGGLSGKHSFKVLQKVVKGGATKIVVTYDSLHKLQGLIDSTEWRLLVDECHTLIDLDVSDLRSQAAINIKNLHKLFKSYCFMSATPTPTQYSLDYMAEMDVVQLYWANYKLVEPIMVNRKLVVSNLSHTVTQIALDHLEGRNSTNAHIFINSVKYINTTLKMLHNYYKGKNVDLSKVIRIVVANCDKNDVTLKDFKDCRKSIVKKADEPYYKVNFYTSTAFMGVDIYDKHGITYLVTDGRYESMQYNIDDLIPQLSNRIRDSLYPTLIQYFTKGYNDARTKENIGASCDTLEAEAKEQLSTCNSAFSHAITRKLINSYNGYIRWNNQKKECEYNSNARGRIISKFMTRYTLYIDKNIKFKEEYYRNSSRGLKLFTEPSEIVPFKGLVAKRLGKVSSFKELCNDYLKEELRDEVAKRDTLVHTYFRVEGITDVSLSRLKTFKYSRALVKQYLISTDKYISNTQKIRSKLGYRLGQIIPFSRCIPDIQKALDYLGIKIPVNSKGENGVVTTATINSFYTTSTIKMKTIREDGKYMYVYAYKLLDEVRTPFRPALTPTEVNEVKSYSFFTEDGYVDDVFE